MSAFSTILLTLVTTMLINNVVLSQFMGLCPFLGVSKQIKTALGMGAAVIFVITASSAVTAVLYRYVLLRYDLTYLNTIVFIVVIAALVQLPGAGRLSAAHHHQLRRSGGGADKCSEGRLGRHECPQRFRHGGRVRSVHSAAGRHPGEDRAQSDSQGIPWNAHHAPDSGTDGDRVLWLQVAGVKGAYQ